MKKNNVGHFFIIACIVLLYMIGATACSKKYITGGKVTDINQYKSKTTYDVLSSLPQFDSLVQLIDAAGLKDAINQPNSTFFAVQNSGIYIYLNAKTLLLQNTGTAGRYAQYTFDSLLYRIKNNINGIKDSLSMYLVPGIQTTPNNLTATGVIYPTALPNDSAIISYEITTLDGSSVVSTPPLVVYFTPLWGHYDIGPNNPANAISADVGTHTLVATSFINTSNGVINVLNYASPLFFFEQY